MAPENNSETNSQNQAPVVAGDPGQSTGIAATRVFRQARWIFLKEINSFMGSNLPALSIGIVVFICGLLSVLLVMTPGTTYEDIARVLYHLFYIFTLLAALFLSMSAFVNERRQGTLELLYTLPVTDLELVLGKFLMGAFLITGLVTGVTLVYVAGIAEGDWYVVVSGLVGLILTGLYAYSVGVFASSLSDSYLISLLIGGAILVLIDIGGFLAGLLPEPAKGILTYLHGLNHFLPFTRGVIPLKGVVFFASLTVFFLFLTVRVLESRRWRGQA